MRLESRRDLLRLGALGAVSVIVPACSDTHGDDGSAAGDGLTGAAKGGGAAIGGKALAGGASAGGKQGYAGKGGTNASTAGGTPGMNQPGFPTVGPCGSAPPVPPGSRALVPIPKLPDPFKLESGTRITTKAEWACRRAELKALAEKYLYGAMPPKPSSVTAMPSGNKLLITCSEGGRSITFSITVSKPSSAAGPAPAIIGLSGSSLGGVPFGIGAITFDNNQLAEQANQTSRNKGLFFDLYGTDVAGSGACIAWAWGVSRIIDALEQVDMGINPTRLGVTGCSRNGKGALVAGAWDDRIALALPEESGLGGVGCWRIAEHENQGQTGGVQTASEIARENVWLSTAFESFARGDITKLPLDQHSVIAIRAPLPILIVENSSQLWLGPKCCYAGGRAAFEVWRALGRPDTMGFSQYGDGGHCAFQTQNSGPHVTAFCRRFLLGDESADTASVGVRSDGKNGATDGYEDWVDWNAPTLVDA
jgi:hypothetical protein